MSMLWNLETEQDEAQSPRQSLDLMLRRVTRAMVNDLRGHALTLVADDLAPTLAGKDHALYFGSGHPEMREDELDGIGRQFAASVKRDGASKMGRREVPLGVEASRLSNDTIGVSVRAVRDYSIDHDAIIVRFDILYG